MESDDDETLWRSTKSKTLRELVSYRERATLFDRNVNVVEAVRAATKKQLTVEHIGPVVLILRTTNTVTARRR